MTGTQLLTAAYVAVGAIPSGITPSTEEQADGLAYINLLLGNWSAQQLPCLGVVRDTVTGDSSPSYTIGTSGDITTGRAQRIKSVAFVAYGVTTEFAVVAAEVWADGSRSNVAYYDGAFPTGNLYMRPSPSGGTIEVYSIKPLTALASMATAFALADGWEHSLMLNVALWVATSNGLAGPLVENVKQMAADSVGGIATLQRQVLGEASPQQAATE